MCVAVCVLQGCKWTGPMQYANATNERMMLPTDMALLNDRGTLRCTHPRL